MLAQALAREVLELVDIRIVRGARGNDESLRDLAANRIGNTDHGGLLHVRMLEQRCLDLDRAHRPAGGDDHVVGAAAVIERSEEHTSELQSLMRISYAVLCLKKKKLYSTHS